MQNKHGVIRSNSIGQKSYFSWKVYSQSKKGCILWNLAQICSTQNMYLRINSELFNFELENKKPHFGESSKKNEVYIFHIATDLMQHSKVRNSERNAA